MSGINNKTILLFLILYRQYELIALFPCLRLLNAYNQCSTDTEREKLLSSIKYGKLKRFVFCNSCSFFILLYICWYEATLLTSVTMCSPFDFTSFPQLGETCRQQDLSSWVGILTWGTVSSGFSWMDVQNYRVVHEQIGKNSCKNCSGSWTKI